MKKSSSNSFPSPESTLPKLQLICMIKDGSITKAGCQMIITEAYTFLGHYLQSQGQTYRMDNQCNGRPQWLSRMSNTEFYSQRKQLL